MKLENKKLLPFNFEDDPLISKVSKFLKLQLSIIPIFTVYKRNRLITIGEEEFLQNIDNNNIKISDIRNISIVINSFYDIDSTDLFDKWISSYTYSGYIYELFNKTIDKIRTDIDKDIYLYTDYEDIHDLFDIQDMLNDYLTTDNIYGVHSVLDNLHYRIDSLINVLNIDISIVYKYIKEYLYECGLLYHKYLSFTLMKHQLCNSIYDDNGDKVAISVEVETGVTILYQNSSTILNYNKEDTKMPRKKVTEEVTKEAIENKEEKSTEKKTTRTKKASTSKTSNETESKPKKSTTTKKASTSKKSKNNEVLITAGDKRSYIYFDIKMSENTRRGEIVSIACLAHDGKAFYAENNEIDETTVTNQNIINQLFRPENNFENISKYNMIGNKSEISAKLIEWINKVNEDDADRLIQFVTDNSTYSFALLLELLSDMDLKNVSKRVLDINQDIATSITRINSKNIPDDEFNKNFVPVIEAGKISRIDYVSSFASVDKFADYVDNAAVTVAITRSIHQKLWNL